LRLALDSVWYSYPGQRGWALKGVSASLEEGKLVAVVGPNGSGKTTLLKVAGLLLRPRRGRVLVDGVDYWLQPGKKRAALRREIVYVHEKPIMLRGSVAYNIAYGLTLRGLSFDEAVETAGRILDRLGGSHLLGKDARSLSLGEAQLVSIARAVAVHPRVLLLDDPLSGLDEERREILLDLLEEYKRQGPCVVVATHDAQASRRADVLFKINSGSLSLVTGS
jgi:ABC-type lipoprotein export system ATPase subunit